MKDEDVFDIVLMALLSLFLLIEFIF